MNGNTKILSCEKHKGTVKTCLMCEFDNVLKALHDAINSPKGIVPDSALGYYNPDIYEREVK